MKVHCFIVLLLFKFNDTHHSFPDDIRVEKRPFQIMPIEARMKVLSF